MDTVQNTFPRHERETLLTHMSIMRGNEATHQQTLDELQRILEEEDTLRSKLVACMEKRELLKQKSAGETKKVIDARKTLLEKTMQFAQHHHLMLPASAVLATEVNNGNLGSILSLIQQVRRSSVSAITDSPLSAPDPIDSSLCVLDSHEAIRLRRFSSLALTVAHESEERKPADLASIRQSLEFRKLLASPFSDRKIIEAATLLTSISQEKRDRNPVRRIAPLLGEYIGKNAAMLTGRPVYPQRNAVILPHIRQLKERDMPHILKMEHASYTYPWDEEDFFKNLRSRNCRGMVAEYKRKIVGYYLYKIGTKSSHFLRGAVHEDARRQSIGESMIAKTGSTLSANRRVYLDTVISEDNKAALCWASACGFDAKGIVSQPFDYSEEDGYRMKFSFIDPPRINVPTSKKLLLEEAELFLSNLV